MARLWVAAGAAACVAVFGEEVGALGDPPFGDRVAHQNDFRMVRQCGVLLFETSEVGPVGRGLCGGRHGCEGGGEGDDKIFQHV